MPSINNKLTTNKWYKDLKLDCNNIISKGILRAKWELVEAYHQLGKRILLENDNFKRNKIYGHGIAQRLATDLNLSVRNIYRAMQFSKKYPDLQKVPEGKNVSWYKICNKYLSESVELDSEVREELRHACPLCGKVHYIKQ